MKGIVAAGDAQTAEAGAEALRAGGTAVDAAVAAAFASFVVESPLGSPAGGGALLYGSETEGFTLLDFFSVVPGLGGDEPHETDFFGATIDFGPTTQVFHIGRGSAAVPTALQGLLEAHRRAGRLSLREVLAPAIALAREGYSLSPAVHWVVRLLQPILTLTPETRRIYGAPPSYEGLPPVGARLDNPALADFLSSLADEGSSVLDAYYEAVLRDFGPARGGLITARDLSSYAPVVREPLAVPFHGTTVLTNSPPASGGALIGLGLRTLERHGLGEGRQRWLDLGGALEVMSRARAQGFDARLREPGEIADLLSDREVDRLVAERNRALTERSLGSTTHISVLDAEHRAASLTISNGEGCGHVVGGTGIHMNNFLGEEDINPDGFHVAPAGRRMTTMMAPTVVLRDGRPILVLGSGGSNRIRSVVLQAIAHTVRGGLSLPEAVALPRLHVEGQHLWFESFGLQPDEVEALRARWPDHAEFERPNMFFGGVHGVADGDVGAGDSRRGGAVARV